MAETLAEVQKNIDKLTKIVAIFRLLDIKCLQISDYFQLGDCPMMAIEMFSWPLGLVNVQDLQQQQNGSWVESKVTGFFVIHIYR